MDTDSLYLALAQNNLYDCIRPSKKQSGKFRGNKIVVILSNLTLYEISSLEYCDKHKNHNKREPGLFKEGFRCTEMICFVAKFIVATMPNWISTNSAARD